MISSLEMKPFPETIQGSRITLVRLSPSHISQVWEYIRRDHELGGCIYQWVRSEQDVAKYITFEQSRDLTEIDYLIFHDQIAFGSFHIHTINYSAYKAEIGYAIEKGQEGKGYASEAFCLIEAALMQLGFNKLVITCNSRNQRSIRLAKRNGFEQEGLLVQDCIEDGAFRDTVIFGKLIGHSIE